MMMPTFLTGGSTDSIYFTGRNNAFKGPKVFIIRLHEMVIANIQLPASCVQNVFLFTPCMDALLKKNGFMHVGAYLPRGILQPARAWPLAGLH